MSNDMLRIKYENSLYKLAETLNKKPGVVEEEILSYLLENWLYDDDPFEGITIEEILEEEDADMVAFCQDVFDFCTPEIVNLINNLIIYQNGEQN